MRSFYVYILTNNSRTLYVGMTNDLERRIFEHKTKSADGFTSKYNITRLVYYEDTNDPIVAIEREKQVKGWLRQKKIEPAMARPRRRVVHARRPQGRTARRVRRTERFFAALRMTPNGSSARVILR